MYRLPCTGCHAYLSVVRCFRENSCFTFSGGTMTYCRPQLPTNKPPHDKTNKMACAPSEDSDQPGHPPSLIRVFAVRLKKAWVLSYTLNASEGSDQTGRMPRLI